MEALIGGKRISSESKISVRNPATMETVDTVPLLSREQVKEAIESAWTALDALNSLLIAKGQGYSSRFRS